MTNPSDASKDPRTDLDAKLEAEIEAALGDMPLEDMLDIAERPTDRKSGPERRTGTVVSVHGNDVLVEFGPKAQGVCPLAFFKDAPALGQQMEFIVDRFDQDEGLLVLRREGTVTKAEWESLEVGQLVEARCTGTNKGGLEMEIAKHRAFMPAGQVDLRHIPDLNVFVGEKMPCEVMEIDRSQGRIILSRKAHLAAERAVSRDKLLGELEVGNQMPAVITSVQAYGAFADLGGIDGLIHISDMAWERVSDPKTVVKEGDQVTVQILKIDDSGDQLRIGLGMKQTMSDPSQAVFDEVREGETVTGRVTKLMQFGAFVEIGPGVEGLIHISELSHERVNRVSSVVKPDEVVTAQVLSVDKSSRRISLSLKAMQDKPEAGGQFDRGEDPEMRRLKAQLNAKFGDNLKGGLS